MDRAVRLLHTAAVREGSSQWAQENAEVDVGGPAKTSVAGVDTELVRNATATTHYDTGYSRRIYILGLGNIGKFVAHSLAGIPNPPPITLLLRGKKILKEWNNCGRSIDIVQHKTSDLRTGFDIELAIPPEDVNPSDLETYDTIHNLIVSVKAPNTVSALSQIAYRLSPDATILFLQNGMGMVEEVNDKVFNNPDVRPTYMAGVITHGLHPISRFASTLTGHGTIGLGVLPGHYIGKGSQSEPNSSRTRAIPPSSRYLLRTLTRTPVLAAMGLAPLDLLQMQLEKLAVNAVLNPLTVMFDCKNGELLGNFAMTRVMRLLLSEISLVLRSLPELQGLPNLDIRFSPSKLEYQIVGIATTTSGNHSSMLQDVNAFRITEIDYISGYIIRRGEEIGIKCVMNYMLLHMVKGRNQILGRRAAGLLPLQKAK